MRILPKTVVQIGTGKIEGTYEKGLYVFKGVPYAAPPVGPLRWLPPQPHKPWQEIRPAKTFGTVAPQPPPLRPGPVELPGFGEIEPQNEDCLFLNVRTPGPDCAKRPVMFWIHGGAFIIGSGSQTSYRGDILASRGNVVLVSINYRIGLLGFLNLNEVTKGRIPATGNEGLLDQIAALEWVKDNIAAFGGDPSNVTVFGESAGGMSIGCLLAMPKAQGLFHKAILESGVGSTARPLDVSMKVAEDTLKLLGLQPTELAALRAIPAEKLISVQIELTLKSPGQITPVAPVIDGQVLPVPLEAVRAGSAIGVPLVIGTNLEEWKLFAAMAPSPGKMDEATLMKTLQQLGPVKDVSKLIKAYRDARNKRGEPTDPEGISSAIQTDIMFRLPAIQVLEARVKNKEKAYSYLFTWKSPMLNGALGACHALEIGFVFGTYDSQFCGRGPSADKLAAQIQDAWIAFARSGNPSCESLGTWPEYGKSRRTMILGQESSIEEGPYDEERQIWSKIGGKGL